MVIPKTLKEKWGVLRSSLDAEKLSDRLPGSDAETFRRAFRLGRCSDEVFKIMADFYEEKANVIKEYL